MESALKQRLIGAAVLAALAIIFLPLLLKGPDVNEPDATEVPLSMPTAPDQKFETRELSLAAPDEHTPRGGVLGMDTTPPIPVGEGGEAADSTTETVSTAIPMPEPGASSATSPMPTTTSATSPPTTAAASPSEAFVAAGNYAVNIGSFSNVASANKLIGQLKAAKLPVVSEVTQVGASTATRVRLGPYADRIAAEAARLRADNVVGGASKVIVLDAPVASVAAAPKPAASVVVPDPAAANTTAIESGYAVQLSAPSVETDALALRDRARALGFSAFVQRVETDSGARFRVRVGPVADRSAADALRDSVNLKLGSSGIVVRNP